MRNDFFFPSSFPWVLMVLLLLLLLLLWLVWFTSVSTRDEMIVIYHLRQVYIAMFLDLMTYIEETCLCMTLDMKN